MTEDFYSCLELQRSASIQEVRQKYRLLMSQWHPDLNPERVDECAAMCKRFNAAYAVLGNAEAKERYDQAFKTAQSGTSRPRARPSTWQPVYTETMDESSEEEDEDDHEDDAPDAPNPKPYSRVNAYSRAMQGDRTRRLRTRRKRIAALATGVLGIVIVGFLVNAAQQIQPFSASSGIPVQIAATAPTAAPNPTVQPSAGNSLTGLTAAQLTAAQQTYLRQCRYLQPAVDQSVKAARTALAALEAADESESLKGAQSPTPLDYARQAIEQKLNKDIIGLDGTLPAIAARISAVHLTDDPAKVELAFDQSADTLNDMPSLCRDVQAQCIQAEALVTPNHPPPSMSINNNASSSSDLNANSNTNPNF